MTADGATPLVALSELPGARPKPPRATGLYHFAILVPTRLDLARSLRRLVEVRYPLQGASDHLVSEAILTSRELAEVYGRPVEEARAQMDALAAQGLVERLPVRGGEFWGAAAAPVVG